jgi:hypothetical protein
MIAAIRFNCLVIVGTLLSGVMLSPPAGYAQLPPPPPTPCSTGGECGSSGGDTSGGSPGGAIGDLVRLPGDFIRKHNEANAKKATALYEHGLAAYQNRDWAAAAADFKKALKLNPKNQVISDQLAAAQAQITYVQRAEEQRQGRMAADKDRVAEERRAAQQRDLDQREAQGKLAIAQQNKIAVDHIQQDTQDFAQSLRAAPSSRGLDFNDGKSGNNTDKPSELTFMDSDHPLKDAVTDRTCTFGTACNPNPNLGGPPTDAAVTSNSTPEQLSSAAKSGKDAATAETLEKAKDLSNCQFDEKGCRTPDAINIPRPAQTPGAVELAKHIPPGPARDDKQIQQSMAYYQKLDGEKIGTKSKLEAVQKQIDSHAGDATILNAQKATLSNDLKRYEGDQEKTQAQIKERLVTIGVKWDEGPAPTTVTKPVQ